jgi:hypothetical protein
MIRKSGNRFCGPWSVSADTKSGTTAGLLQNLTTLAKNRPGCVLLRTVARQIAETGKAIVEKQLDLVGGAMAMFLHQYFGAAMAAFHLFEPFRMF